MQFRWSDEIIQDTQRDLPKFDSTCGVKKGVYLVLVLRCYCQDIVHHLLTVLFNAGWRGLIMQ